MRSTLREFCSEVRDRLPTKAIVWAKLLSAVKPSRGWRALATISTALGSTEMKASRRLVT